MLTNRKPIGLRGIIGVKDDWFIWRPDFMPVDADKGKILIGEEMCHTSQMYHERGYTLWGYIPTGLRWLELRVILLLRAIMRNMGYAVSCRHKAKEANTPADG